MGSAPGRGPGLGLGYFLLPAGGVLSLTGVITGDGTLTGLSWIMWLLGILLLLWNRSRRPADPRVPGGGRRLLPFPGGGAQRATVLTGAGLPPAGTAGAAQP
ncbi:hypothetical protein AB0F00_08175, partial [Streptomyces californicus]